MLLAFIVATVVWLVGSALLAGPIWLVLHRRNIRGPIAAGMLGLLLGFAVSLTLDTQFFGLLGNDRAGYEVGDGHGLIIKNGVLTSYGWQVTLRSSGLIAICSAIGGIVTWWLAYRRPCALSNPD